jgi:hypothetical protein
VIVKVKKVANKTKCNQVRSMWLCCVFVLLSVRGVVCVCLADTNPYPTKQTTRARPSEPEK